MTRWELITNDNYIIAATECIIRSKCNVGDMRKALNRFLIQWKAELLHGEQPSGGCGDKKCKACYPYKHLIPKTMLNADTK